MTHSVRAKTLSTKKILQILAPAGRLPRLVLLAGLPASGKSTFADGLVERGFTRISLDEIRKEIYGDVSTIGDWKVTRRRFDELFDAATKRGDNILIDNTNFMRNQRTRIIDLGRAAGYVDIHVVVMDVSLEECLRRNRVRERHVDEKLIREMHGMLSGAHFPRNDEAIVTVLAPTEVRSKYKVSGYTAQAAA